VCAGQVFDVVVYHEPGTMDSIDVMSGRYQGTGRWFQADGKTMAYRVVQVNRATAVGFEIEFDHDFDDGSQTRAALAMTWTAPHLFRVDVAEKPVGNGYFLGESCHYHIAAGEAFVEVGYRANSNGLEVTGSSTKNAEGLYIAWQETLRRVE
jgi:hypothetical protein